MDKKTDENQVQSIEHSFESPLTTEKKVNWMKILLTIGVLAIFSAISFYIGKGHQGKINQPSSDQTTTVPSVIPSSSPQITLKPGWTTYVHPIYKYSVNLPPGWSAYTKTYDPAKGIEFRSSDYTEVVTPEGVAYQKSGKRIFFAYKSNPKDMNDYKIIENSQVTWLGTSATFIRGHGLEGTDIPDAMALFTHVDGKPYQLYMQGGAFTDIFLDDKSLFLEIASTMQLSQNDGDRSSSTQNVDWKLFRMHDYNSYLADLTLSYPPDCTVKTTDGLIAITCKLPEGAFIIYPEASGGDAAITSTDSIRLGERTWERRKFSGGQPCQATGTSYLYNTIGGYADPLIVCFDERKPILERAAEDIIRTFKSN